MVEVIDLDTIARGAHLLPIFGSLKISDDFSYHCALASFNSFFVNHFIVTLFMYNTTSYHPKILR